MIGPAKLLKIKSAWERFSQNHPKFISFLNAAHRDAIEEGTVIEINVTTASGKTLSSNIKLQQSDIEMFKEMSEMLNIK